MSSAYLSCPCCRKQTLTERGAYEICVYCGWEDDGQDDALADEVWGGPNGDWSLTAARAFAAAGGNLIETPDPADRGEKAKQ